MARKNHSNHLTSFEKNSIFVLLWFHCVLHPHTKDFGVRANPVAISFAVLCVFGVILSVLLTQSYTALPGDQLYAIKTRVVEPLQFLKSSFLETRMWELEKLALQGALSSETFTIMRTQFLKDISYVRNEQDLLEFQFQIERLSSMRLVPSAYVAELSAYVSTALENTNRDSRTTY